MNVFHLLNNHYELFEIISSDGSNDQLLTRDELFDLFNVLIVYYEIELSKLNEEHKNKKQQEIDFYMSNNKRVQQLMFNLNKYEIYLYNNQPANERERFNNLLIRCE